MNKYRIDKSKEIILFIYFGNLTLPDIGELEQKLESDTDYSYHFDRIYDFRNCKFDFEVEELSDYIEFEKENLSIGFKRKEFFLTRTPNHVVLTTIYESLLNTHHKYQCFIVSTTDAIIHILSNPNLNKNFLDRTFDEMKTTQPYNK